MHEAVERKRDQCRIVVEALRINYVEQGWTVLVLPLVVGVRGITDTQGIRTAMQFIGIPMASQHRLIRSSALASVEGLSFMHRVRNSSAPMLPVGPLESARPRKRKRSNEGDDAEGIVSRWRNLEYDPVRLSISGTRASTQNNERQFEQTQQRLRRLDGTRPRDGIG